MRCLIVLCITCRKTQSRRRWTLALWQCTGSFYCLLPSIQARSTQSISIRNTGNARSPRFPVHQSGMHSFIFQYIPMLSHIEKQSKFCRSVSSTCATSATLENSGHGLKNICTMQNVSHQVHHPSLAAKQSPSVNSLETFFSINSILKPYSLACQSSF